MGTRHDERAVTVKVDCADGFGVSGEVLVEFPIFDVPNADTFVHGAAGEEVTCGVETQTEDVVCMSSKDFDTFCLWDC